MNEQKQQNKWMRALSVLFFAVGLLLAMAISGLAAWADLEASLFGSRGIDARKTLTTFHCPNVITTEETSMVSAKLTNPTDREKTFLIYTKISMGFVTLIQQGGATPTIQPGETVKFLWEVDADDAVWNRIIMARVYVRRSYPLPARTATCGIIVLNVPGISGSQIVAAALAASLLSMSFGISLWWLGSYPMRRRDRSTSYIMIGMAIVVLLATFFSLLGWWLAGGLLFAVTVLIIISTLGWFVYQ